MPSTFNFLEEAARCPQTTVISHKDCFGKNLHMFVNIQYRSSQAWWHASIILAFKWLKALGWQVGGQTGLHSETLSLKPIDIVARCGIGMGCNSTGHSGTHARWDALPIPLVPTKMAAMAMPCRQDNLNIQRGASYRTYTGGPWSEGLLQVA